ncbi:MAG TPA: hydrogen gas-evolving membrane-bound hydrogenase subunit E [Ilumatobacter sp.]|nr:hydrogen gas-evolving membrane-bound hydrogenase subunit E [Ilumatobacter sp.]
MLLLPLLHALTGTVLVASGPRLGRRWGAALGALAPLVTLIWLLTQLPGVLDGDVIDERTSWVDGLALTVDLRLDGFAALMVLLVSGIGVLVFWYSAGYFSDHTRDLGRLFGLLTWFSGAMVGLVLADNLFVLYMFWELTSITSYLLIGNSHENARARASALHALLVTGLGGLVMFVGFMLIGQAAGTFRLSEILADPPSGGPVTAGLVLVIVGAASKSAQYPFHSWLPGAMVAPTPISAYLHSATMVKAGVYLVARFAPAFAGHAVWRPIVLTVGLVTMVAGGLRALRQHDLKLLLAFGTVSQLGMLFVLFGAGLEAATLAGVLMLFGHALFKATLFMVVGIIDHQTGTRDLRALPGFGRPWLPVVAIGLVAAASMAGVPLLFGFIAKEQAFAGFDGTGYSWSAPVLAVLVGGSCLTAAYSARWAWGAFTAGGTDWHPAPPAAPVDRPPRRGFWAPPAVLATATLALGVAPMLADGFADVALSSLVAGAHHVHLALWHGPTLALALSLVVYGVGAAMFVARRPISSVLARGHTVPNGSDAYLAVLRALNRVADLVTRVTQSGSLPFYAGVILLTAAVAPGLALLIGTDTLAWPDFLDSPAHIPVVLALVGGALGAALVPRRLAAALFLSVVGYGMAALFVVEGAPDLALTQVTVETLGTVLFVLVLRRLPRRFSRPTAAGRIPRLFVSAAVGAAVFAFALVAADSRTAPPVSDEMIGRAYPDGHGKNIVNVILVDFRGIDTLGEIMVLGVAAVGAVALARAPVGSRRRARAATVGAHQDGDR